MHYSVYIDSDSPYSLSDKSCRKIRILSGYLLFCENLMAIESMMKKKIVLEYPFRCTPGSLFRAISTPLGLKSWFADRVVAAGDRYDFFWNKTKQSARLVHHKHNAYVRYQWDESEDHYLEMRISYQELTGDMMLTVIDFVEDGERDDCRTLWDAQIDKLKRAIGCPKK